MQKIKHWLVKRLGGYTREEYDDWSRIPIVKPPIIREVHRTTELRAVQKISQHEILTSQDYQIFEKVMLSKIENELKAAITPYITWNKRREDGNVLFSGTLTVLVPESGV